MTLLLLWLIPLKVLSVVFDQKQTLNQRVQGLGIRGSLIGFSTTRSLHVACLCGRVHTDLFVFVSVHISVFDERRDRLNVPGL